MDIKVEVYLLISCWCRSEIVGWWFLVGCPELASTFNLFVKYFVVGHFYGWLVRLPPAICQQCLSEMVVTGSLVMEHPAASSSPFQGKPVIFGSVHGAVGGEFICTSHMYRLTHGFRRHTGNGMCPRCLSCTARGRSPRAVQISAEGISPYAL